METSMNQTRYICGCCKKELPEESFYVNSKQHRDNYCKECRKVVSRDRYVTVRSTQIANRNYPVITRIADRETRMELISHALQVVAESIERKRRKRWDEDLEKEEN